jgi:integrase
MARRTRAPKLETRTARLKLPIRKKPYSVSIAPGVILLYRRNQGPGTWGVRLTVAKDEMHRLATADDQADADGRSVLDFWQAQDAARAKAKEHEGDTAPKTVEKALDDYEADLKTRGADAGNVTRVRGHLSSEIREQTVSSLKGDELKRWRAKLAKDLAPSTVNRTMTCFKAALNLAAAHDDRIIKRPWETGLAVIPDAERPRNVILTDAQVRAIVTEAYQSHPPDARIRGDARIKAEKDAQRWADELGLLVEVLAVTGARVSQAARLDLPDLQGDRSDPRLMMPSSRKGKGVKKFIRRPVPIPVILALRLRVAASKRGAADLPLLAKPSGERWSKSDHSRPFERLVERLPADALETVRQQGADPEGLEKAAAEFEGVTIYALRHSSIARQLLAGVPIRIVAVNHDTSVAMIERTYSHLIADHADALSRKALLDVAAPAVGHVAHLTRSGT